MTMKKILCICMALVMALGCTAALAEEDLQAQLDAANAKIAELQAQVDAYYPFYAAQIVATYGEDGIVWLEDVQAEYEALASQYASFGLDLAATGMDATVKQGVVTDAVTNGVVLAKGAELGLAEFDEETLAAFEAQAQQMLDYYVNYYISYYYPEAEEITEEMTAEALAYWAENGLDVESGVQDQKDSAVMEAVNEYVAKDVAITEEDVQAEYQALIEANKADYTDDRTYNGDRSNGVAIAWHPEGYRTVKHVLVMFSEEQAALYADLQAQLSSLNAEKDAIENPVEAGEAAGEAAEETAEQRAIEEVNADIAACATELEALYSQLLPTAQEVIDAFNNGTDFDALIAEYNADPGMQREPTASAGYAVTNTENAYWEQAFVQGAMSIANKGEISQPVYGSNGIHIIYYMDDVVAGEVALEEIREDVEAIALDNKISAAYQEAVAAWVAEANVEYFYENFGVNVQ